MSNGQHVEVRQSKTKKIVLRILAAPFLLACLLSAVMIIFGLFNLKESWAVGGIIGFILIGALTGFIGLVLYGLTLPPAPQRQEEEPKPLQAAAPAVVSTPSKPPEGSFVASADAAQKANDKVLASIKRREANAPALAASGTLGPIVIQPSSMATQAAATTKTISGSYEAKIYVYDPRPVLKLREGLADRVTVVMRPITLRSRINGSQWRTGIDDGYAIEYKGKPFGVLFNNIASIHIRTLIENGAQSVELTAVRRGWYQRGVPEVYVMVPTVAEAKNRESEETALKEYERRQTYGVAGKTSLAAFRITENNWGGPRIPDEGLVAFEATVEKIPTPDGSKAKPHIAIKSGGTTLAEITARSATAYAMSEPLEGRRLLLLASRYYTSINIEAYER
ncbi:hypothetical protein BISA_1781 [Bifidobacterium saguini DSM 23967]|uniref:Uncharacterized protein n=2 Tax=Bifidobacterium saguini TaxID=762210 RepID=A0A087D6N4_9BIFI|nr:hypothetical protein BISA_1781 [Bifidobacterium saguini DSM 23967]